MPNERSRPRPQHGAGPVTLQDVALRAGVSLATASRALHGAGGRSVGEVLRARVLAAAEELSYVSNAPAQALARASSTVVGLIVHDVADPYFAAVAAGAMRAARERQLMVMIAATFREPGMELTYLRQLRAQRARAVVLAGSGLADPEPARPLLREIEAFQREGGRVVSIGDRGPEVDAVLPDQRLGAEQAVRALWNLGHRRIGVIAGPAELTAVQQRLDGARRALRDLGGELPPEQVTHADFTRSGGRAATVDLFARTPGLTAVLALNDVMAAGCLLALRSDVGRAVPQQVSVVGYDDVPFAVDLRPALSTVRLPLESAGAQAIGLIALEQATPARRLPLEVEFIQRDSTGPAPV